MRWVGILAAAVFVAWCGAARAECTQNSSPQACYTDGLQQITAALAQVKQAAAAQDGASSELRGRIDALGAKVAAISAALNAATGQFSWLAGTWCADNGLKLNRSVDGTVLVEHLLAYPTSPPPSPGALPAWQAPPNMFLLITMEGDALIVPPMVRLHSDGTTLRFLLADGAPVPGSVPQRRCS